MKALIFDVDGTLAETEDLHRRSFNVAFAEHGLDWEWDTETNRGLLAVSGGLERMNFFQERLPEAGRVSAEVLKTIHAAKRRTYARMLAGGALSLRPGVWELLEAAGQAGLQRAVVTAASRESFDALANGCLPVPAEEIFEIIITGDDVSRKKPDPQGYLLALDRLGLDASDALVFEDSPVGHAAARAAGIRTVVTPSPDGPLGGDFGGSLVLPSLEPAHWPAFGFPPAGA
ncbi:HAD-IA family hydrolase [Aliiruegeria sabulilitoris]|uniref:HAD-IA family hydrolase n=1 Tax=Aliiruegeria sabulilitoris TaxID=1510458 RepID=UPI0008306529|nr:HAD-IA family hydrolase [Aliiruegeria sabulilitoris]NDR58242.1 HAD-IA family hydrolase [Pseudoruegeria sp. M32A2M]